MSDHNVVLYGNDSVALIHSVVPFIASAIQDSGAALVIAGVEHERAFRSALQAVAVDTESPTTRDRLIFLSATEVIKGLLVDGRVDRARFDRLVGAPVRKLRQRYTVHAYGEVVGILRSMGRADAAADLERLWGDLAGEVGFRLLCGYPIDVLGTEFHPHDMDVILTSHAKLISVLANFASSLNDGIALAFGQERAAAISGMIEAKRRPGWATLGEPESTLLWLREHLPQESPEIIAGAKTRFDRSA